MNDCFLDDKLGCDPRKPAGWTERFDTLDRTATVPISADVHMKYMSYVVPAQSSNEYSIVLKTSL